MAYVDFNNIEKRYGEHPAVSSFNLSVEKGEMVALLGPSGCGKTTTLRMLAGFLSVSGGTIRLDGRDITAVPSYRRNIGMVFQGYALFPHMTVAKNVAFGLEMRRLPPADISRRVAEALARVRLEAFGDRLPRQLSGGQQQRVALARAMAINPDVLLLDEPLSALDARLRHEVRAEIRMLQRELGLTTLIVTHDQDEALSMSDRLVVMNKGSIEQIGTPEQLYEQPANRFVAEFMGKTNFIQGRVESPGIFRDEAGHCFRYNGEAPAGAACLSFRPERTLVVAPDAPEDARFNVLAGEVVLFTYLGASVECRVRLDGGRTIAVLMANTADHAGQFFPAGSRVKVIWAIGDSRLLP